MSNAKTNALSRRALITNPVDSFRRGEPLRVAANAAVVSREEAQAIVEKAIKLSKADGIDVGLNTYYNGNVRFAANQVSTSGATTDAALAIQSSFGPKHAVVTTNDLSDEAIRRCVEQSERKRNLRRMIPKSCRPLARNGMRRSTLTLNQRPTLHRTIAPARRWLRCR